MQTVLKYLIVIGLVVWGFLLYTSHRPETVSDDAPKTSCEDSLREIEGERALSYSDRVRQFVRGCW